MKIGRPPSRIGASKSRPSPVSLIAKVSLIAPPPPLEFFSPPPVKKERGGPFSCHLPFSVVSHKLINWKDRGLSISPMLTHTRSASLFGLHPLFLRSNRCAGILSFLFGAARATTVLFFFAAFLFKERRWWVVPFFWCGQERLLFPRLVPRFSFLPRR